MVEVWNDDNVRRIMTVAIHKLADDASRIDVSTRLRRAIAANDLALVKRILKNNRSYLTNPDFSDKCNTSLHLAAQYGFIEVVVRVGHVLSGE